MRRPTTPGEQARRIRLNETISFLTTLANLSDNPKDISRFAERFPAARGFRVSPWLVRHWAMILEGEDYLPGRSDGVLLRLYWLMPLRETLRAVWRAPDRRSKLWGIMRISQDFFQYGDRSLVRIPLSNEGDYFLSLRSPSRFEEQILQFIDLTDWTGYCANPDCQHPYYLSKRKKKYCNRACAKPAQQAAKRKWFNTKGSRRRADKRRDMSRQWGRQWE
jgi:hypothetical protein